MSKVPFNTHSKTNTFLVQYKVTDSGMCRTNHTVQSLVRAANNEEETLDHELRKYNLDDAFEIIGSKKVISNLWVPGSFLTDAELYDVVCDYYDRNGEKLSMVKNSRIGDFITFELYLYELRGKMQAIMRLLRDEELENYEVYRDLRKKKEIEAGASIHKVRTITPDTFKLVVE